MKCVTIMRDSDLITFLKQERKNQLWTDIESEPLTYKVLQDEILIERIKHPDRIYPEERTLPNLVETLMWREGRMFDQRYFNWTLSYDFPVGQIYVQSRVNNPREALNLVTLIYEKDLQTDNTHA